jgi:tetratricopeptide (TPR) repeat protein
MNAIGKILVETEKDNFMLIALTFNSNSCLQACTIVAETDYQLVTAVCYIRLGRFNEAGTLLESVLRREPENERALYHLSFCRRAQGRQKDAIEYLTKVREYGDGNK